MANLSTQNIGTNYKGMLNLGSTINTPLSTTLQAITDGDGNTTPLQLATNRIALGTSTGTSLLNFPDAGTTAADGISFGTSEQIYRYNAGMYINARAYSIRINDAGWLSGTSTGISFTPSSLTGSQATSALSITQTWNTTGNPTAIFANITNTASGASANLMDLQVGGVSQFKVKRNGDTNIGGASDLGIGTGLGAFFRYGVTVGGLNYPVASAALEVISTTKGFLPPRMTTTQVNAIATPAEGLVVFNTTISHLCVYQSGAWVRMSHSPM